MRILAIDPGEKRIGMAVSDETGTLANPLKVILHTRREEDARAILEIFNGLRAEKIVMGQAMDDEGQITPSGRRAKRLAEEILQLQPVEIEFWDESFSTQIALETRRLMNVRRAKRSGHLDEMAAAIILQSYLDTHTGGLNFQENSSIEEQ